MTRIRSEPHQKQPGNQDKNNLNETDSKEINGNTKTKKAMQARNTRVTKTKHQTRGVHHESRKQKTSQQTQQNQH